MEKEYIYAVTRIHGHEKDLLDRQDMERLLAAQNAAECMRLLTDKGWDAADIPVSEADVLLTREREKTWALVQELAGTLTQFEVFCYENDFHNLKAAIKLVYSGQDRGDTDRYFLQPGTIAAEAILRAIQQNDLSNLPPLVAEAGKKAYEVLIHTSSGQACDMVIDYAASLAIDAAAKRSGSDLMRFYAQLKIDTANIKAAVRSCRMGKKRDFLERAIAPAGSLDRETLISAAAKSLEEIYSYLSKTEYAEAVETLKISIAAFECWCDNRLMESIRPQRYQYFTIEPLAAYILGREIEIAMVRLIISAKINRLSDEVVRKRWRVLYV